MLLDPATLVWGLLCWWLFSALANTPRPVRTDAARQRAQATWERRVARGRHHVETRVQAIQERRRQEALAMYTTHVKRLPWR